jgi:hypothetical protein
VLALHGLSAAAFPNLGSLTAEFFNEGWQRGTLLTKSCA